MEQAHTPKILQTTVLFEGWGKVLSAQVRTASGKIVRRQITLAGQTAAVLPYDERTKNILLVRLLRAPVLHASGAADILEVAGGRIDPADGGDPERCARREAFEELGVQLTSLQPAGISWASPGVSTERVHLFLGAYETAQRIGPGGGNGDEAEEITVVEMSALSLWRLWQERQLQDWRAVILLGELRLRRPDLFDDNFGQGA